MCDTGDYIQHGFDLLYVLGLLGGTIILIFSYKGSLFEHTLSSVYLYSHLSNKRDVTLTDFGKFHPAQNENSPCTFIDFITKLSIFLQNLMKIFLMVILSYKSLF